MCICSKCNLDKSADDFYDRGDGKKKRMCKVCDNKNKHAYYLKHRDKIINQTHLWYQQNKQTRKVVTKNYQKTTKGRLVQLMRQAKNRSIKNNLPYDLNIKLLLDLWKKQSGRCALTNIDFILKRTESYNSEPFAPSIDKINPKLGYTIDNIRLVCVAVNYALNEFGEDIFKQICLAYLNASTLREQI